MGFPPLYSLKLRTIVKRNDIYKLLSLPLSFSLTLVLIPPWALLWCHNNIFSTTCAVGNIFKRD